jgi:trk system potassium uptake protein TrkA
MTKQRKGGFVVIGLDTFGATVAQELARFGNHVLGIDTNDRRVADLADSIAEAVIGDGQDEQALRDAGVPDYDVALVALGDQLEASLICTMNLKLLGVPKIWVQSISRTHHRILVRLGADRVIDAEQEIGRHVAQMLHNPLVRDYVSLGNGYFVIDFLVPEEIAGKPLGELALLDRFEIRCLGLMRGSDYVGLGEDELILEAEDKLLLLGRRQDLRAFADSL